MNYYRHPQALVESDNIGTNTRIWAFAHVLPQAVIGSDCNICDHVFIENDVVIGSRVTIKCGVQIWDGIRLEDDVFVGPNATFTNDAFPRSRNYPENFATITVCRGASIGANATILPNLVIGRNAMVGAGAVVTRDVPPNAIVVGNPACIKGYVNSAGTGASVALPPVGGKIDLDVSGVELYDLPLVKDMRGNLSFAEYGQFLPFMPKRYFLVFDVPSREVRGEHAHREQSQFLICVKGACSMVVDDNANRKEVRLDRPTLGLYLPPMVWGIQYKYSADAVLLVLASDCYDAGDYIRDYDEFCCLAGKKHA
ncbi:MAG: WxcM-like domain-containing protein [Desulfuromonadales bacterium]|nr:WxcM-like domain-containing protein [Desulfuromonadales bacterium]